MKLPLRSPILWTWPAVIAILAVTIACETESAPSPTPTPVPTPTSTPTPGPTPTPTPTPTPPPTATPLPSPAAPGPEPQQPTALEPLKLVAGGPGPLTELAAAVPDLYERVSFIDLTVDVPFERLGDDLEQQLSILGPVAELVREQVDAALLAQSGPGILVVLRGRLDPQVVLDALGAEVRVDPYGDFEIWNVKDP